MKNFNLINKIKEKFSIKVFAIFTVGILIISASFISFFIYQQSRSLTDELIKKGKILTRLLAYNSRLGVFSESKALLEPPIYGIIQQDDVLDVSIYNTKKDLLIDVKSPKIKTDNTKSQWSDKSTPYIFKKLFEVSNQVIYTNNKDRIDFFAPIISTFISDSVYSSDEALYFKEDKSLKKGRIIGFVKIGIDKENLNERLRALLYNSLLLGIIFIFFGSTLAYSISKRVTKKLNRLTESVKTLGTQGIMKKISVESKDEIGKLAQAFNNMSELLKKREIEKEQLEEKLRYKQKMEAIGTLAGGIAHDFNNILHIIAGFTEMVMDDIPAESLAQDNLKQVLIAVNRAKSLVDHILAFSLKSKPERLPIKIQTVVVDALEMVRESFPSTIEIQQKIDSISGTVLGDPSQIRQVVINMCTNSAYAMQKKGGKLIVSLSDFYLDKDTKNSYFELEKGAYVKLTVSDDGEGIDSENLNRIFDPYFTTKEVNKGTGMGLSAVHGIVKSHGGMITVHSNEEYGTTFYVYFPKTDKRVIPEFISSHNPYTSRKNICILFIDDEESIASMHKQLLGRLGYEVVSMTSSVEALEIFKAQPDKFDLVITDQTMPSITGDKLAKQMIRLREDIPIILCSGYSDLVKEIDTKNIGIKAFIKKPVMIKELNDTIENILTGEAYSKVCAGI